MVNGKIYCTDALEKIVEDESVDLFFCCPPVYGDASNIYGGNIDKQLNNSSTYEEFLQKIVGITKRMADGLKPTGSIIMMLANTNMVYDLVHRIKAATGLKQGMTRIWDFGSNYATILHFHKDTPYFNPDVAFSNNVIRLPFIVEEYVRDLASIGFIQGVVPENIHEFFVNKYTKPGDTIANLMGGTGTICTVGMKTGREYIYNDYSATQVAITLERIKRFQQKFGLVYNKEANGETDESN